jgi:hypothetical protein
MMKILTRIFGQKKKETRKRDFEWENFQKAAKQQFKNLRDKGISIPVV